MVVAVSMLLGEQAVGAGRVLWWWCAVVYDGSRHVGCVIWGAGLVVCCGGGLRWNAGLWSSGIENGW